MTADLQNLTLSRLRDLPKYRPPASRELWWNGWSTRGSTGVPVSARALEILVEDGEHAIGSEWVCSSPGGWVLSGLDCSDLLRELAFEFLVLMAARSGDALPMCSQFRESS